LFLGIFGVDWFYVGWNGIGFWWLFLGSVAVAVDAPSLYGLLGLVTLLRFVQLVTMTDEEYAVWVSQSRDIAVAQTTGWWALSFLASWCVLVGLLLSWLDAPMAYKNQVGNTLASSARQAEVVLAVQKVRPEEPEDFVLTSPVPTTPVKAVEASARPTPQIEPSRSSVPVVTERMSPQFSSAVSDWLLATEPQIHTYASGKPRSRGVTRNGGREGEWTFWFDGGPRMAIGEFGDGHKIGP
jgi:hypothetical protein